MIYINCKYKAQKKATGVDKVAEAYNAFLNEQFSVREIMYNYQSTFKKNIEEQLFFAEKLLNEDDIVIHPTNTAPLRKLIASEILVLHDLAYVDYPQGFSYMFRKWYSFLIPRLVKSKDHIITVSKYSKQRIIEHFGINPENVTVVCNGIREVNDQLNFDMVKSRHFLAVGSITERKNHECIIKAHKKLPNNLRKRFPLKIVGGRSNYFNEGNLESMIDQYIHLMGYVDSSDLKKLYIESLAYLSASRYEGFGLPILEALSFGKHVICSDIPPYREILGLNYEYFFSPEDADMLATLMREVADKPQYFSANQNIVGERLKIAKKYLWKNTLVDLKKTIEMLNGNSVDALCR